MHPTKHGIFFNVHGNISTEFESPDSLSTFLVHARTYGGCMMAILLLLLTTVMRNNAALHQIWYVHTQVVIIRK